VEINLSLGTSPLTNLPDKTLTLTPLELSRQGKVLGGDFVAYRTLVYFQRWKGDNAKSGVGSCGDRTGVSASAARMRSVAR
jgi:hypothetical protein